MKLCVQVEEGCSMECFILFGGGGSGGVVLLCWQATFFDNTFFDSMLAGCVDLSTKCKGVPTKQRTFDT